MEKIPKNLQKQKKITTIHIGEFSKVTEYKVNIQKTTVFILTSNEQLEI